MRLAPAAIPVPGVPTAARARAHIPALVGALSVTILVCASACRRTPSSGSTPAAASASSVPSAAIREAFLAADRRDPASIPTALASSPSPADRRAHARALAQIAADPATVERLGRALSDDDSEVVGWAAYGLGLACDVAPDLPRENRSKIVRALVARALTLEGAPRTLEVLHDAPIDPWSALAWSLGRCGGIDASRELAHWLGGGGQRARAAAFALGAIAQHDRGLEDDVANALLDIARGGDAGAPLDEALYPFGRGDWSSRPTPPRLAEVVRAKLAAPSTTRVFALRAIARGSDPAGTFAPQDLHAILYAAGATSSDRVEALRALHRLGVRGDSEVAAFATRLAPTDETLRAALVGAAFGPLRVAVELLAERTTPTTTTSLRAFVARAPLPAGTSPPLARRLATLSCLAAAGLHPGAAGEAEVVHCADHDAGFSPQLQGELDSIRDDARVTALDRADVRGARRDLLLRLAREARPRVRERAIAILARHPEAKEAPDTMVRGLSARELGVVASTAQALAERPSLAFSIPRSAIREALDPKSPPPEAAGEPVREVDVAVRKALDGALARPLEESDAEIKAALAAAVGALQHAGGRGFLLRLCGDRGPALRRAARLALAQLDSTGPQDSKRARCDSVTAHGAEPIQPPPFTGRAQTIALDTEVGVFKLHLDPTRAPIAVARIAELASAGFYDGTPIHRVVPGFVVQLGDPGGDGYGGAHAALRCETAPTPFATLDIGVALAGRDTGSSQIFVMLARAPHLDGSYSWLGHAEGPWDTIAEGDLVLRARLE